MDALSTAVGAAIGGTVGEVIKQGQKYLAAALGHPNEDIGTVLGTRRHERIQRGESVLGHAGLILLNLGHAPVRVSPKILEPSVEAASREEDPELQEAWANLLANAAHPNKCNPVLAVFPGMLKVLSPREIKLLDHLYDHKTIRRGLTDKELEQAYRDAKLASEPPPEPRPTYQHSPVLSEKDANDLQISLDILLAARILWLNKNVLTMFSPLGWAFLSACRPPEK
jgi:hypothetical protein